MPTEFILVQLLMAWTYMLLQTTLVSILQQIIGGKDSCSWKPVWWTVLPPSPLWDFVIRGLVALSNVCSFFCFSFFFLYFLMTFLEDRPYRLKEHSYIRLKISNSISFHVTNSWRHTNKATVQLWRGFVDLKWLPYQPALDCGLQPQATGHHWCESTNTRCIFVIVFRENIIVCT